MSECACVCGLHFLVLSSSFFTKEEHASGVLEWFIFKTRNKNSHLF